MDPDTLSFNEIAPIMGLTRRTLSDFCDHAIGERVHRVVQDMAIARHFSAKRHRVDAAAFYLWFSQRGRHSPTGLPSDKSRGKDGEIGERHLCNTAEFAELRKGLIDAGWIELRSGSLGIEYMRGNDWFRFHAFYVEHHWRDNYIERRGQTYFYSTGTVRYEKQRYIKHASFEEFVSQTMTAMFDRKPAKLNGLSFREWALTPVSP